MYDRDCAVALRCGVAEDRAYLVQFAVWGHPLRLSGTLCHVFKTI